ncbi:MAG: hypothetical protein KJ011_12180 [Burkholderiaceae bacterium]|nr:hypothetical protein [Burkholderiaceae bacterium]
MTRASASPSSATGLPPPWRVPLLVLGFVGLVFGTGAGLARLGWSMPSSAASVAALHGPLMICGFFGVVISLERAVAIGRYWAYLGPLLTGLGSAATVFGATAAAPWFFLAGGIVLLAASLDVYRRQTALFTFTLALGAACWPIGVALWAAGAAVHEVVAWWLGFLILTIAGERLELSRFLPPSPPARYAFAAVLFVIVTGMLGANQPWGAAVFALGLLALAVWLLKQDIARRTVRNRGLTRFIAVCLLSGYAWLAVGGATLLAAGSFAPGTPGYGAAMHALALGFVFSMVFGHAAIIFPAVLRVAVPYHPTFYLPLALLHLSLIVRLAGEAAGRFDWTRAGGLLTAVALAAFIVSTASAVVRGARDRAAAPAQRAR